LAQSPHLGDVLLEIIDGIVEFPTHELGLVSKSCSDQLFLRERLSRHREFHLFLQVLNLDAGVSQMIICPVEIKAFFAGSGVNQRQKLRLKAGDGVLYYSPTTSFGGKDWLQAFTTIGRVADERTYQADMGGGFHPFRRDLCYVEARDAPIAPLLDRLEFTRGKRNWGYAFRYGLVEISASDFAVIAEAMGAVP